MARKRYAIPQYGTVIMAGKEYYRTRIEDADGKRVALYGRTREELYDKVLEAREQIEDNTFRRSSPTVKEYCEKWLLLQSAQVRATTLTDYTSKVNRHIIKPLGHMNIADVTADDIRLALVPVSKKSASVYKSVNILYKSIFAAAKESKVIQDNPTIYLSGKNGGVPQKEKNPLTDDQVERLLDAIRGLPPYVFVMLGLYAGLRREEILALQWDSVFLDEAAPYLTVCRAWHTEHNRPVIMSELKTKAAHRDVPLPDCLAKCLREAKENSTSDYVVANSEGEPLSYTQFKRLWQYIVTRTVKERSYYRYENGATPYISVRRAWRSVNNRPVISTELKTPAAKRDIPIPGKLVECLKEAKEKSKSEYVISDRNGNALAESQFVRVWKYIAVRSTEERCYYTYVNGQKIKHVVQPKLGEHQPNNPKLVYTMDFQVTPHQLRHTYITNLIYASVDPKTVQYLAGHENSKVTMDIYAKVKYNKPAQLHGVINRAIDTSKKD